MGADPSSKACLSHKTHAIGTTPSILQQAGPFFWLLGCSSHFPIFPLPSRGLRLVALPLAPGLSNRGPDSVPNICTSPHLWTSGLRPGYSRLGILKVFPALTVYLGDTLKLRVAFA